MGKNPIGEAVSNEMLKILKDMPNVKDWCIVALWRIEISQVNNGITLHEYWGDYLPNVSLMTQ